MKRFVTYDPATSQITGKFLVSDGQEENYQHRFPITEEEYNDQIEVTMRVDPAVSVLIPKNKVVLTVSKTSMLANGIDSVTVTCGNLAGSGQVEVGADRATVSPGDNQVAFTTDTPGIYTVKFIDNLNHYCQDYITLTAT